MAAAALDAVSAASSHGQPAKSDRTELARLDEQAQVGVRITGGTSGGVRADTPALTASPPLVPISAPLMLNGKLLGTISGQVDVQGNGLVDTAQLLEALKPVLSPATLKALTERIGGQQRIGLDRLRLDGFQLSFDPQSLEFHAELQAKGLANTALKMRASEPPNPGEFQRPAMFSGGANLSVGQVYDDSGRGLRPLTAAMDGLLHVGGFTGPTLTFGADYDGGQVGHSWQRREIRLTEDFFGQALRATGGEFTPSIQSYQGAQRLLGFGIERAYDAIRPFENIRPVGHQDFLLDRESTVDVYVNNVRLQTLRLQPGRYSISDFPFAAGPNQVRLEVEDIGGRREIASFDAFSDTQLLNKGVVDFGASLGAPQALSPYTYRKSLAFTGYVSKGVADGLTAGLNAQALEGRWQLGTVLVQGSRLGLIETDLAASSNGAGLSGQLAALAYRRDFSLRERDDVRVTAAAVFKSPHFQDAFSPVVFNDQALAWQLLAQWSAPHNWGLSLGYAMGFGRGQGPDTQRVDVGLSKSFRNLTISTTAGWEVDRPGRSSTRFTIGISRRFGARWFADAHYDTDRDRSELRVTRAATGNLNDVSGELDLDKDRSGAGLSGRLLYINNRFDAELMENRAVAMRPGGPTSSESRWLVSTFVGFADNSWGIGRPVGEFFVIAPLHSTLSGAKAALVQGDQVVARTGWLGAAVAPITRAYAPETLALAVDPLPTGYDLGPGLVKVFPSYGAGYRAPIGSDASHTAMGTLFGRDGPVSLAGGVVRPMGGRTKEERPFFTNRAGRFVADHLAPGRYQLVIQGRAVGEFSVPKNKEGLVNVGDIRIQGP